MDDFTRGLTLLFCAAGIGTVLLSWRSAAAAEAGEGEYYALLLTSILGMVLLVAAENFVVLFIGFELLSIPLYVLCATHMRREHSLESGLKYLIIGSRRLGHAALRPGADLRRDGLDRLLRRRGRGRRGLRDDPLLLAGVALVVAGLAFKASVAPFHQWTPDVYEGAPTPITAFMAVATKAAAFGVLLRLFDVALIGASDTWGPALAALAAITIVIGNVGAIGQSSLKRLLAYSSVAQAGYMLAGVVVSTRLGIQATIFYLAGYVLMNMAAFAVITARERETAARRRHLLALRPRRRPAAAGVADDDRDALARRLPGHRRLLRQALPDPGGGRQRVRLARRGDRDRLRDLARLLPARDRGGLDAAGLRRRAVAARARRARARRWPAARPRPRRRGRGAGAGGAGPYGAPTASTASADGRSRAAEPPRATARAAAAPARGGLRRGALRARHGRVRDLARAARSTSPATRARRSPRWSSAARARPADARRCGGGRPRGATFAAAVARHGGEFRGATTARVTSPPPPRRRPGARSSTSGCWPSWRPRSRWPRRRRGWRGCRREVARVVRTGVCIVAGDVCRASDAAAAGLRPCTLSDERRGGGLAVTILSVRIGGEHQWLVARRSDGSVAVTKVARDDARRERRARVRARAAEGRASRARPGCGSPPGSAGSSPTRRARGASSTAAHYGLSGAIARWPAAWRSGEAALAASGWAGLGVVAHRRGRQGARGARGGHRGLGGVGARRADRPRQHDALPARGGRRPAHDRRARRPARRRAARSGRRRVHARRAGPRELAFRVSARGAARAPGRRDRRAAGPARPRQPRGRRAAAAPPRAVAAVGRRGPARGRRARRSAPARWSAASTPSRTARARSSWPAGWAPRSASRRATRRSTGGCSRRAPGRPDRKNAPARTASRNRSSGRAYFVRSHTIRRSLTRRKRWSSSSAVSRSGSRSWSSAPSTGGSSASSTQRRRGDPRDRHRDRRRVRRDRPRRAPDGPAALRELRMGTHRTPDGRLIERARGDTRP